MSRGITLVATGVVLVLALVASLMVFMLGGGGVYDAMNDTNCAPVVQVSDQDDDAPATNAPEADDGKQGIDTTARAALRTKWTRPEAEVAVAVATGESDNDPEAANAVSTARGLWQIMLSYHQPKFDGADWRNPYENARVAYIVWKERGWQPWTVYTSGAYKEHLPAARAAIERVSKAATPARVAARVAPASYTADVEKPEPMPGLQAPAQKAADFVKAEFKFDGDLWGYADRNIAGTNKKSAHASGLAIDVMLDSDDTAERELGDRIADYFRGPGAEPFGVANVIWMQRIANSGNGWKFEAMEDRGSITQNHFDHVHIDFDAAGGTGTAPGVTGAAALPDDEEGAEQTPVECDPATEALGAPGVLAGGGGSVVYPLASGAKYDRANFGGTGGSWSSTHTGTDYSVPCGTTVRAATAGTVQIETDQLWAGPKLVKVSTGPGKLATWYAHMQSVTVDAGERVQAGQTIGEVGSEGNSTGCHLHFEYHPKGGSIYADDTNPTPWLKANVGKKPVAPVANQVTLPPVTGNGTGGTVVASFNVLGYSHTEPGGHSPWRPNGTARMPGAVQLLVKHGVTVAGLQEFQPRQIKAFNQIAGKSFDVYADKDNAVAWRSDMYDLVEKGTLEIPYFKGNPRDMPWVLLDPKGSGDAFYVMSVHNPANVQGPAAHHRATAVRRELAWGQQKATTGRPVLLTGDFNARGEAFCGITGTGLFRAAAGTGTCQKPPVQAIDWIFGANTQFSAFTIDKGPAVKATSDHPLHVASLR